MGARAPCPRSTCNLQRKRLACRGLGFLPASRSERLQSWRARPLHYNSKRPHVPASKNSSSLSLRLASFITTCKRLANDPFAYLRDVLGARTSVGCPVSLIFMPFLRGSLV